MQADSLTIFFILFYSEFKQVNLRRLEEEISVLINRLIFPGDVCISNIFEPYLNLENKPACTNAKKTETKQL